MGSAVRYHSEVDLADKNGTYAQLIRLTGRNKIVLEVGPSTGYLTEILRSRRCRVSCVEVDPEAAERAARFCERMVVADVESLDFSATFPDVRFDVVVFGDVLEDFVHPLEVLKRVKDVLKPGGYVVASMPNISHGSIRLSLLGGQFRYTELGLLDRTHLRFFTRDTIEDLFWEAGYSIKTWRNVECDAFGTEQALQEQDYPPYLVNAIRSDREAMVYQFVVKASPSTEHDGVRRSTNGMRALRSLWTVVEEYEGARAVGETLVESQRLLIKQEVKLWCVWNELVTVRQSIGHRVLERYRRGVRWLLPPGSRRGRAYINARRVLWRGCVLIVRSLRLIRREGIWSFVRKATMRMASRPRRPAEQEEPADTIPVPDLDMDVRPLTFPSVTTAAVSIVIPVYNKAIYTYNCLKSVLENSQGVPYQLVVVDDGSSDETPTMLSKMANVRVLTNPENVGFLEACNRGIRACRGKYVVLLNNDTQVGTGWLAALFETIDSDDSVGMVGAKLLYPSGRLQEAGGIVWSDGSTWTYGRDDDPVRPEYNYVREVDYCGAACLITRSKLLEQTQGFDPRFAPGYYEDPDLAFQIRHMGYRVLYQPRAQAVHHERISWDAGAPERLQREHRSMFEAKWREVLSREYLPVGSDPYLARDRRRGARVMVIDDHARRDRGGRELGSHSVLKTLHELGYSTTLLAADLVKTEPSVRALQQLGIEVLYGEGSLRRFGKYFEVVIVSRPELAQRYVPLIRIYAPQATVYYNSIGPDYARELRRAEINVNEDVVSEALHLRALELEAARACDGTFVMSRAAKVTLQQEIPGTRAHVVTNADTKYSPDLLKRCIEDGHVDHLAAAFS